MCVENRAPILHLHLLHLLLLQQFGCRDGTPPPTLAEGVPERATARLRLATNRLARLSTERRLIIAAPP